MLFSAWGEKLWDTWLVERDRVFYLFYIRIGPEAGKVGPAPKLGEGWDGISLATSTDLLHWDQRGPVLEKHPDAAWLGTGMIHRAGGRYVMNFSEERPAGEQVVSFAESSDLLTWKRMPESFDLRADESLYQRNPENSADPLPRWDSIGVVLPEPDRPTYLGMICANTVNSLPGQCGTLGLLESTDGVTWDARPPIVEPGLFPSYEVPEHVQFGDHHYVLFSTNSTAGPRFDARTVHPHSGTYYVVADQAEGPYRLPPGDPMLLGHRMLGPMLGTYVGRPFRTSTGEQLFYHQWTAQYPIGSWGPPKRLVERSDFTLALEYWAGTEALKSQLLLGESRIVLKPLPSAGRLPVMEFVADEDCVRVTNRGGAFCAAVDLAKPNHDSELSDGRIVEARVRIDRGRAIGIWAGMRGAGKTAVSLNVQSSSVEIGTATYHKDGSSMTFDAIEVVPWGLDASVDYALRLIYRQSYLDIYIDDELVTSFVTAVPLNTTELGVYSEIADGQVGSMRAWSMA